MGFMVGLVFGGSFFVHIAYEYLTQQPYTFSFDTSKCTILPSQACDFIMFDFWTFSIMIWTMLHISWTFALLIMQLFQISSNKTTNEQINYSRFDYLMDPADIGKEDWKRREYNMFNMGPIANCIDFWGLYFCKLILILAGTVAPLRGLDWVKIYKVPQVFIDNYQRKMEHGKLKSRRGWLSCFGGQGKYQDIESGSNQKCCDKTHET